jgi:hypothetical protein
MLKIFQSFLKNEVKTNGKDHWVAGTMYKNVWNHSDILNKEKN